MMPNHLLLIVVILLCPNVLFGQQSEAFTPDRQVAYKKTDKGDLLLHVFEPDGWQSSDQRSAIVFFFGGGWVGGAPKQFFSHCRHLADRGMVAMSAEYRTRKSHGTNPFACVEDGRSAVEWIRSSAAKLGVDANRIVAGGGSAGGHVAACTAVKSPKATEAGQTGDDKATYQPDALVLFNPVIDTSKRGFGNNAAGENWRRISPVHNVHSVMPPSIIFHGIADTTVPITNVREYRRLVRQSGGQCELIEYPGEKHAFFNLGRPNYADTIEKMDRFLESLGYLEKKSAQ